MSKNLSHTKMDYLNLEEFMQSPRLEMELKK